MAAGNAVGRHHTHLKRQFSYAGLFVGIRDTRGCGMEFDCAGNASICGPGIVGRVFMEAHHEGHICLVVLFATFAFGFLLMNIRMPYPEIDRKFLDC